MSTKEKILDAALTLFADKADEVFKKLFPDESIAGRLTRYVLSCNSAS